MSSCKNCLLPSNVPNANLDHSGTCSLCHTFKEADPEQDEALRRERELDLESTLANLKGKGEQYDALICLSGGKDSIYLLHKIKNDYGLKVLAFTTDMNVPPVAWDNIHRTIDKLDIDHVVYKPQKEFYRKFYRFLLQNQEERGAVRTVCYVCAPLFEGYALKIATEKKIPLILAGYSPEQPDPARMLYEFKPENISSYDWTPTELKQSGLFTASELAMFWNPGHFPAQTHFPRYIAPFHAWEYNQEKIMKAVVKLGLIKNARSASPIESNCHLNWLLMYSDLKNLGYNPYMPEFAALIRHGKASKLYWLLMMPIINAMIRFKIGFGKHVKSNLDWLGLKDSDLLISRSKSTEWTNKQ